ncbi:hypothetical protein SDC9_143187 [bioreactor metagenome]|uniref:Uncharacterized protein n=1 Tax=bioreactor metagenome TaxID=1076179 RepID=A0A645E394_9ZZZZ
MPMLGNQPKYREKTSIRSKAKKNEGVETESKDNTIIKLSINLL